MLRQRWGRVPPCERVRDMELRPPYALHKRMPQSLEQQWREFKQSKLGRRFQERYERPRRARTQASLVLRILLWFGAAILTALGIVFVFIPGPAFVFFLLAGGLIATESRAVARFMDWGEVKGHALFSWSRRRWKSLPAAAKAALAAVTLGGAAGIAYFSYWLWFG